MMLRVCLFLIACGIASCGGGQAFVRDDLQSLIEIQSELQEGRGFDQNEALQTLAESKSFEVRTQARFLLAHLALRRSQLAVELAQGVAGTRQQWVDALRFAQLAEREWRSANEGRGDWPMARRNVERAQRWAEELIDLATSAGHSIDASDGTNPPPDQGPTEPNPASPMAQESVQQALPQVQLQDLQRRLDGQEQRKLNERASRPELDRVEVERDW